MDVSKSQDPFAPDDAVSQAQEESAQELAPPNQSEGQGPSEPDQQTRAEIFPDQAADAPQSEPQAAADDAQASDEPQDVPPAPADTAPQSEPDPSTPASGGRSSKSKTSPKASDGPTDSEEVR